MQKIIPHLWLDNEAEQAADFYTSIFKGGEILNTIRYTKAGQEIHGQEPGSVMTINLKIEGQEIVLLNGGAYFKLNPSISFFISRESAEEVDALWEKLLPGGNVLMPLDSYPFSRRYGWIQDKFGVSWQIILPDEEGDWRPSLVPSLLFVGDKCGRAEEAIDYYTTVFKEAEKGLIAKYPAGMEPNKEGDLMYGDFRLFDQWFAAMDSGLEHNFTFSEATSFLINCENQEEIDYYWEKLSAVPESEQCGWVKDKFGVSWQVAPTALDKMLATGTPEQAERVTNAFMAMKKLDLAALEKAFAGE